jgi:Spy/CpxP family protein refolding chaperone
MGLGILGIALVVGVGVSGDTKKDKDASKDKVTHRTPTGWKNLKLSPDQKKKVYAVQDEYAPKIADLRAKIAELESQEMAEMVKVLTPEQKAQLTKALLGDEKEKTVKDSPKDKDSKDKADK